MKVTLLMAITVNGFIAGTDDDTDWVKDIEALNKKIKEFGIVLLGKRTYDECMKYNAFPYEGGLNLVMTHDTELLQQSSEKVLFTDKSPETVIKMAEEKGFKELLLIGGGHLNGSFMKDRLIDEVILDIHPLIKSTGIKLFESEFSDIELELVKHEQMNDQILQATYRVKKS